MRHRILVFLLFWGLAAANVLAQDEPEHSPDHRALILDLMQTGPLNIGVDTGAWERNFHADWSVWFAGNPEPRSRADHMPAVHAYADSGAVVVAYELDVVGLEFFGERALIRYNAVETIREGDGNMRVVPYSGVDLLVFEQGRWLIRSSSLSFPARYGDAD